MVNHKLIEMIDYKNKQLGTTMFESSKSDSQSVSPFNVYGACYLFIIYL